MEKGDNREGREEREERSESETEAEWVMRHTRGCAIAVHSFEQERPIHVDHRGVQIPRQRVDLIIEGLIVVELKSVKQLDAGHSAQLISYFRTTGLKGGVLINFRVRVLKDGLQRVVLS